MESMLQIVPDQNVELQGNAPRNGQFYWNGDTDFYERLVVDRDNNYEDNFMTLFHLLGLSRRPLTIMCLILTIGTTA